MGEQKGFWNNATVASVATFVVGGVTTSLAAYFGLTVDRAIGWLAKVAHFLVADVTLPRWLFWSWFAISFFLVAFVAFYGDRGGRERSLTRDEIGE